MATNIAITSGLVTTQSGSRTISVTVSCPNSVGQSSQINFSGASTSTVTTPTGTQAVVITPPAGNAVTIYFKGASADTGTPFAAQPFCFSFASSSGTNTFYLTSSGAVTGPVVVDFV